MFLFDLHCDTLTTSHALGQGLCGNSLQVAADRLTGHRWCQCFALWLDDALPAGERPGFVEANLAHFFRQLDCHQQQMAQARTARDILEITGQGRVAAVLTVENAAAVEDDLSAIARLAQAGVRMMTITWNRANKLAGGQLSQSGLTPLGEQALGLLEQHDIIVDLSHMNDSSFAAAMAVTRRPLVASHACSRTVHHHLRNLSDEQIRQLAQRGGVVGAAFYAPFLGEGTPDFAVLGDHLAHLLRVGGEALPALGGDFDGGVNSPVFAGCQTMPALYDYLAGRFGSTTADRICGQNALDFFERYEHP